jgi:hypothetical protein
VWLANLQVATVLLQNNASMHAKNMHGETPGDLAKRFRNVKMEELLQAWSNKESAAASAAEQAASTVLSLSFGVRVRFMQHTENKNTLGAGPRHNKIEVGIHPVSRV